MQNLTVFEDDDLEDDDHLGPSVRAGQQTSQFLKVKFQKDFATNGIGRYQIKDKDEEKQISGSTVTSALNTAQLTLWSH